VSRLVWLPFDPAELGDPPDAFAYEVVASLEEVPASVEGVEIFIPPYSVGTAVRDVLPRMTSLQVVQTLTAGVDNIRDVVPDGVTLCNGRGIHDTSTAELVLTLTLASLRGVPGFVRAQDRHEWRPGWHESLADKQVLLVGYGAIGAAIEARLAPFECTVTKVARTAREGVHAIDALPELLPHADVVVLVLPLTDETRGLVDAAFLARMREGALLVNVARGAVVETDALVDALRAGRVRAALDVVDPEPLPADSPLWDCPGLLVSPHVGGSSSAMWPRAYRLVRDQLHRLAAGEEPVNVMTGDY
jgi:phosphoglycerate dehydrogenase-like enzyme